MASNGDDDNSDQGVAPRVKLAHPANRSLLAIVSNLLVDSVEHQRALKEIAIAVRESANPVASVVIKKLAETIRQDGQLRIQRADEMDPKPSDG